MMTQSKLSKQMWENARLNIMNANKIQELDWELLSRYQSRNDLMPKLLDVISCNPPPCLTCLPKLMMFRWWCSITQTMFLDNWTLDSLDIHLIALNNDFVPTFRTQNVCAHVINTLSKRSTIKNHSIYPDTWPSAMVSMTLFWNTANSIKPSTSGDLTSRRWTIFPCSVRCPLICDATIQQQCNGAARFN